jgi:hypothetical protein
VATAREHDADDCVISRSLRKQDLDVGLEFRARALEGHGPAGSLETIQVRRAREGAPIPNRKSVECAIATHQPVISHGDHRLARSHQFAVEDHRPIAGVGQSCVHNRINGAIFTHRVRANCRSGSSQALDVVRVVRRAITDAGCQMAVPSGAAVAATRP